MKHREWVFAGWVGGWDGTVLKLEFFFSFVFVVLGRLGVNARFFVGTAIVLVVFLRTTTALPSCRTPGTLHLGDASVLFCFVSYFGHVHKNNMARYFFLFCAHNLSRKINNACLLASCSLAWDGWVCRARVGGGWVGE